VEPSLDRVGKLYFITRSIGKNLYSAPQAFCPSFGGLLRNRDEEVQRSDAPFGQSTKAAGRLSFSELENAIRSREAAVRLVLPRILRRVILQHNGLSAWGFKVPHRKSYLIDREPLLEIVDREELGLGPGDPLPRRSFCCPLPPPKCSLRRRPTRSCSAIGGSCSTPACTSL